jgi:hypothetical protein
MRQANFFSTQNRQLAGRIPTNATRVLFVGENPLPCTSSSNLSLALERLGFQVQFSRDAELFCTKAWLRLVWDADAIVFIGFDGPCRRRVRQLAIATALGRPVVRWWVGTDVLTCLENSTARANARLLAGFTAANVAVAPHLVEELASIGVDARWIPSILDPRTLTCDPAAVGALKTVLAYVPSYRSDFYGEAVVRRAIERNPDFKFIIVADTEGRFAGMQNVESLGWVEDMSAVYARAGVLLRITKHDGLPRMVLEALWHRRHVIYSWPFPACRSARTYEEVQLHLDELRQIAVWNEEGPAKVRETLTPDPTESYARLLCELTCRRVVRNRVTAAQVATSLTIASVAWRSGVRHQN